MTTGVSLSAVVTSSAEKRGKSTCSVSSMPSGRLRPIRINVASISDYRLV
jgi:hypothetical protein